MPQRGEEAVTAEGSLRRPLSGQTFNSPLSGKRPVPACATARWEAGSVLSRPTREGAGPGAVKLGGRGGRCAEARRGEARSAELRGSPEGRRRADRGTNAASSGSAMAGTAGPRPSAPGPGPRRPLPCSSPSCTTCSVFRAAEPGDEQLSQWELPLLSAARSDSSPHPARRPSYASSGHFASTCTLLM